MALIKKFRIKSFKKIKTIVEFNNVTLAYGNRIILDNISFKINEGQIFGMLGPNGVGKSTIFNLISRFIDPKKGNIFINDVNIKDVSLFSLRQNISLVSQDTMIYNDTFHNNISLGKLNATKREIIKAAKLANIHDFILSQENGYDTVIIEAGSNLSGGQKQRISIARAFLKNSKILLLDEVTSALDSKNSKNILKSINQLSKNKTCIYISHDNYEINKNSQKLIISNSKIN